MRELGMRDGVPAVPVTGQPRVVFYFDHRDMTWKRREGALPATVTVQSPPPVGPVTTARCRTPPTPPSPAAEPPAQPRVVPLAASLPPAVPTASTPVQGGFQTAPAFSSVSQPLEVGTTQQAQRDAPGRASTRRAGGTTESPSQARGGQGPETDQQQAVLDQEADAAHTPTPPASPAHTPVAPRPASVFGPTEAEDGDMEWLEISEPELDDWEVVDRPELPILEW
mmetsp:Transcript_86556/g.197552  ORF Transcript_86556/g.197552 Transcript_86556/m.197552 type:complete len:225 (+) Transcript_86556:318-992(+)